MTPRNLVVSAIGVLALATASAAPVLADQIPWNEIATQVAIGKKVAPVTLKIPSGVDANSVYLGSYVVNVAADCNGCHSNNEWVAGHNPFLGQKKEVNKTCYLNGGLPFGEIVSRNITPKAGTSLPAGLTFAQFKHVMLTGQDPIIPGALLQVMPWDAFQNLSGGELQAIYDYLSSIPSLPTGGTSPC